MMEIHFINRNRRVDMAKGNPSPVQTGEFKAKRFQPRERYRAITLYPRKQLG
jgi:hypothetical protein